MREAQGPGSQRPSTLGRAPYPLHLCLPDPGSASRFTVSFPGVGLQAAPDPRTQGNGGGGTFRAPPQLTPTAGGAQAQESAHGGHQGTNIFFKVQGQSLVPQVCRPDLQRECAEGPVPDSSDIEGAGASSGLLPAWGGTPVT